MTRPRSQQIFDPSTRYTSISLLANPSSGSLTHTLTGSEYANFVSSSVTQTFGGCETDVPATIAGTVADPFSLSVGDSFTISVDESPYVVTLTSSEFITLNTLTVTTTNLLVDKINSVVGSQVATRTQDGFLKLTSISAGDDSTIGISGSTSILFKLGFGLVNSKTSAGKSKTRGIINLSVDNLGGYLFPFYNDGNKLLSSSNDFYSFYLDTTNSLVSPCQSIPPSSPILGRLTTTAAPSAVFSFFTKCEGSDKVTSKKLDYTQLLLNDNLKIWYKLPFDSQNPDLFRSIEVVFSTLPTFISDVVNTINTAPGVTTNGYAISSNTSPYYAAGDLIFSFNGNSNITVSLAGTERTVTDIVNTINTAIATASQASQGQATLITVLGGEERIKLESILPVGGGENSSVEILRSSNVNTLKSLGFKVGKYRGWQICRAVGAEIEISLPDPSALIALDSSSTALTSLGLSTYPSYPNTLSITKLIPCPFPYLSNVLDSLPSSNAFNILVSEYLEAGDVVDDNFTTNMLAENTSFNSSVNPNRGTGATRSNVETRYNVEGEVDYKVIPFKLSTSRIGGYLFPHLEGQVNTSPLSIIQVDTTNYSHPLFETYGNPDFPIRTYASVDAGDSIYAVTANAKKNYGSTSVTSDNNVLDSSIITQTVNSFNISFRDGGTSDPFVPYEEFRYQISAISNVDRALILKQSSLISFSESSGKISDINIEGNTANQYLELSSSTSSNGDQYLRLHDKKIETNSILKFLNAKIDISLGDGVNTFGDFNGSNAFSQLASFLAAAPSDGRSVYITVKEGFYSASITFNRPVTIIGQGNVVIFGGGFVFNEDVELNNIKVDLVTGGLKSISIFKNAFIKSCYLSDIKISTGAGNYSTIILNSTIVGYSTAIALEANASIEHGSIAVKDCFINYANESLVMSITGGNSIYSNISFENTNFILSPYSVVSPVAPYTQIHTTNTGLVELHPLNDGRTTSGLVVKKLSYRNCSFNALDSGFNSVIQLSSAETSKYASQFASPNPYGEILSLVFDSCDINANLTTSASASIPYFIIGQGVQNLSIVNCDFNPLTPGNTGAYGVVPDWFKFTNPSKANLSDQHGIVIACPNVVIRDCRINELARRVSASTGFMTGDIYLLVGSKLTVDNLKISAISPSVRLGNGTGNRDGIVNITEDRDVNCPIFDSNSKVNFVNNEIIGVNASTSDWAYKIIQLWDIKNTDLENNDVNSWTSSVPSIEPQGIFVYSYSENVENVRIVNNKIEDVSYGINAFGDLANFVISRNEIVSGTYRGAGFPSYGIGYNSSLSTNYIQINENRITDSVSNDTSFASIDITYTDPSPYISLIYRDSVPPALHMNNNFVNAGNNTKYAYSLKPAVPLDPVNKDPKGMIYGNTGSVYNAPLITQYAKFNILRWNNGAGSYDTITTDNIIEPGKIFGAETDNYVSEELYFDVTLPSSAAVSPAGVPITISNITNNDKVHIICSMTVRANVGPGMKSWASFKLSNSSGIINYSDAVITLSNSSATNELLYGSIVLQAIDIVSNTQTYDILYISDHQIGITGKLTVSCRKQLFTINKMTMHNSLILDSTP